jgi:catechol 2,3-dioxygenase-like lactoylglutathione lyase family enzyme
VGVPGYRISQMQANGGNILDAYGLVTVVSPAGLPIRGVVGIAPDPIMYVAINCKDVKESKEFYENLGFVEQEVPYSRPSKGTTMFEPAPPKNSYYMSPSPNCMGVLLLQGKKKKYITPNPVVESLNIVYKPLSEESSGDTLVFKDPSGVPIRFQSADAFTKLEKVTR